MNGTIFIEFSSPDGGEISISFLCKLDRFEKGLLSCKTVSGDLFYMASIKYQDEYTKIDNPNYIFTEVYTALKNKDKKFLKESLIEEFDIIWDNRKGLKRLIKDLRKKYPELKNLKYSNV